MCLLRILETIKGSATVAEDPMFPLQHRYVSHFWSSCYLANVFVLKTTGSLPDTNDNYLT